VVYGVHSSGYRKQKGNNMLHTDENTFFGDQSDKDITRRGKRTFVPPRHKRLTSIRVGSGTYGEDYVGGVFLTDKQLGARQFFLGMHPWILGSKIIAASIIIALLIYGHFGLFWSVGFVLLLLALLAVRSWKLGMRGLYP